MPTECVCRPRAWLKRVSFLIGLDGKIAHVTDGPSADKHLAEMKDAVEKSRRGRSLVRCPGFSPCHYPHLFGAPCNPKDAQRGYCAIAIA